MSAPARREDEDAVFIPISGLYQLRLILRRDGEGKAQWLVLDRGFRDGDSWRPDSSVPYTIPASLLSDVKAAIHALGGEP